MVEGPTLRASIPLELFRAVQAIAHDSGKSVSSWLRSVVVDHLNHITLAKLRNRAESEPISRKMRTLALITTIRHGITACTEAGRAHTIRKCCAYARYCHDCYKSGALPIPSDLWHAQNTVSAPIAPAQ